MPRPMHEYIKDLFNKHFLDNDDALIQKYIKFEGEELKTAKAPLEYLVTQENTSKDANFNDIKNDFKDIIALVNNEPEKQENVYTEFSTKINNLSSKVNKYITDAGEYKTDMEYRAVSKLNQKLNMMKIEMNIMKEANERVANAEKAVQEFSQNSFNVAKKSGDFLHDLRVENAKLPLSKKEIDDFFAENRKEIKKSYQNVARYQNIIDRVEALRQKKDQIVNFSKPLQETYQKISDKIENDDLFTDIVNERQKLLENMRIDRLNRDMGSAMDDEKAKLLSKVAKETKNKALRNLINESNKGEKKNQAKYDKYQKEAEKYLATSKNRDEITAYCHVVAKTEIKDSEITLFDDNYQKKREALQNREDAFDKYLSSQRDFFSKKADYYSHSGAHNFEYEEILSHENLVPNHPFNPKSMLKDNETSIKRETESFNKVKAARVKFLTEYIKVKQEYEASQKTLAECQEKIAANNREIAEKNKNSVAASIISNANKEIYNDPISQFADRLKAVSKRTFYSNTTEFQSMYDKVINLSEKLHSNPDYSKEADFQKDLNDIKELAGNYCNKKGSAKRSTTIGQTRFDIAQDLVMFAENQTFEKLSTQYADIVPKKPADYTNEISKASEENRLAFSEVCKKYNTMLGIYKDDGTEVDQTTLISTDKLKNMLDETEKSSLFTEAEIKEFKEQGVKGFKDVKLSDTEKHFNYALDQIIDDPLAAKIGISLNADPAKLQKNSESVVKEYTDKVIKEATDAFNGKEREKVGKDFFQKEIVWDKIPKITVELKGKTINGPEKNK